MSRYLFLIFSPSSNMYIYIYINTQTSCCHDSDGKVLHSNQTVGTRVVEEGAVERCFLFERRNFLFFTKRQCHDIVGGRKYWMGKKKRDVLQLLSRYVFIWTTLYFYWLESSDSSPLSFSVRLRPFKHWNGFKQLYQLGELFHCGTCSQRT